jgi:N-acetylmuramoyl-L-alanine amidase
MAFRWTGSAVARHGRRMVAIIALLLGWLSGVPALAATVQSIAIGRTQIVIRFDAPVGSGVSQILTGRRQIAVDIANATPGGTAKPGGVVTRITQRRHGGSGLRMLFDLSEPVIVADGGFDSQGRELTLALRRVDDATFAQASIAGPLNFFPFNFAARPAPRYKVSIPVPPRARGIALPRVEGDDMRPLVVIDAGHGGVDPGAIGPDGLREKDVTLKVAKGIRDALLASGRVRVALTRSDDRFLVLRERYGVARRLRGDLFISVHCDSTGSEGASGATAYTLSEVASDKEAARLAARENKADVISGVNLGEAPADVSSILIDLTQRETMNASATFARLLGREAKPLMPLKPNFHRMASLMVLKAPDMPSILFETGYISNPQDAAFLDSDEGRQRIAESVTRAVTVHFARRMVAR